MNVTSADSENVKVLYAESDSEIFDDGLSDEMVL